MKSLTVIRSARVMKRACGLARERGWKCLACSSGECYFFGHPQSDCCQVYVSIMDPERLVVQVVPKSSHFNRMTSKLEDVRLMIVGRMNMRSEVKINHMNETDNKPRAIDVMVSFVSLGKRIKDGEIEDIVLTLSELILCASEHRPVCPLR